MKAPILFFCAVLMSFPGAACVAKSNSVDLKPLTDTLKPREVVLDTDYLSPWSMTVADNCLVMTVMRMPKSFQVAPLPLSSKVFGAGPSGRGPMDFLNVDYSSLRPAGDGFVVADAIGMKQCHVEDQQRIIVNNIDRTSAGNLNNGLVALHDGYIDTAPQSSGCEFVKYTKSGKLDGYISKFPDFGRDKDVEPLFLYMKRWDVNQSKKLIVEFYSHFDKMRILNFKGKVIREADTDWGYTKKSAKDISRICYVCISSVTDEYIPALHISNGFSEIQIWDWDAAVVRRLIIKGVAKCFTIDWKKSKIYWFEPKKENTIFEADFTL